MKLRAILFVMCVAVLGARSSLAGGVQKLHEITYSFSTVDRMAPGYLVFDASLTMGGAQFVGYPETLRTNFSLDGPTTRDFVPEHIDEMVVNGSDDWIILYSGRSGAGVNSGELHGTEESVGFGSPDFGNQFVLNFVRFYGTQENYQGAFSTYQRWEFWGTPVPEPSVILAGLAMISLSQRLMRNRTPLAQRP